MNPEIPIRAGVVIIGGGIIGCSVAYHLALLGQSDVVLLERKKLTSGTTWHAAGLVGQLRATHNLTRLAQYTANLYARLERETGSATGFRQTGSLSIATTSERFEELKRGASMARSFGLNVEVLTPDDVKSAWPLARTHDLQGALFLPEDGQTNPVDTTQALARGAKARGVRIIEDCRVTNIRTTNDRVTGVMTENGEISADVVVNCGGMWARDIGGWVNATVPVHAAEHFYIVTKSLAGLNSALPVLRDQDGCAYFKEDAGKLLVGWFEPIAKPWGQAGIPESFSFDQLPDDLAHIEPLFSAAIRRVPALEDVGIQLFFNGPESFTPDDRYLLGETPEVRGLYVAAGFNSIGIQSAGGVGKVLADWIIHEHAPMDLWDVDIRRCMPFQGNRRYLTERTVETPGLLYAMHWPFRQAETARNIRKSVLHDRLRAAGACFGEIAGFERPNWYAPTGVDAVYDYSYGRQNWFEHSAREHHAVREGVGLFDQSSFAKFQLEGRDACSVLNRLCTANVDVPVGKIVYTQWLNPHGGIEADLTITREAWNRYLIVTACATHTRDLAWLRRHIPDDAHAVVSDVSASSAVLGIMGPLSRALLSKMTDADLSNDEFPFGTSRIIDLGYARIRASRITYVGELGWELYIGSDFVQSVYDEIVEAGKEFDLKHVGYHAMNSLRVEKAYRHWGHDITDEDTPLEAGLAFTVDWTKPSGFIGLGALQKQKEQGVRKRLIQFMLESDEHLLYHDEPIWRDDRLVGRITSAMFGHTFGRSIGMGYVALPESAQTGEAILNSKFEIEIATQRVPAKASLKAFYDPASLRIRS